MLRSNPRPAALAAAGLALILATSAQAEIRIGFANALSGPFAATGHRNQVAAELAVGDLNTDGGLLGEPVELIVADDACGVREAQGAAKTLIAAGVDAVIGHLCSHSSLIAAGHYEAADVLMITASSTHPRLTEEGRKNVFRLIGRDDQQGQVAADLLAERHDDERIAILHDGSTYGAGLAYETRKRLRVHGVEETLFARYLPGADDQDALVDRLIRERIDVVYIGGYGPDAALILKTARERGADLQMIGGDALAMDEFRSIAGEAGDGTIFSRPAMRDRVAGAGRLLDAFKERGLGERPGGLGVYAAVEAWAAAVERAGTGETQRVAQMLRRGRFDTVLGRVSFDVKGDLEEAVWSWHIWWDGDYEPVGSLPTQ
jgi:branched-chain amino acid transport system substrate-binding protein